MAFILSVYASRRENSNWSRKTVIINIWVCVTLGILKCHVSDVNCFQMPLKNVIWAKIADKNSSHRERHKKQSDLEKFKGLKENRCAKPWRKINRAPGNVVWFRMMAASKALQMWGPCRNRPKMNKICTSPVENKHTPIIGNIWYSGKNPGLSKRSPGCTTSDMT